MWHPLRGVLEPFSEHRFLLSRGHGSAYHQRGQNGYSAASGGPPRACTMARKRKATEAERRARKSPDEALQAIAPSYRNLLAVIASIQLALRRRCQRVDRQLTKPLACTAQWRKSANRMVKGPSPERRATASLRRKRTFICRRQQVCSDHKKGTLLTSYQPL
jgi:hypothetical protein